VSHKKISVTKFFLALSFILALCGCTTAADSWNRAVATAVDHYSDYARANLEPYFRRADVSYPPKAISLLVFKNTKTLQLWAKDSGSWRYIRTFPILAASGGPGPKQKDGDYQVPEGIYHIVEFNPYSHYFLSLMLDYPNSFDRYYAARDGRRNLGEDIFIHGHDTSVGCIAIGNRAIPQIFVLSYLVGLKNIKVIIAPDDLRYYQPIYSWRHHPWWTAQLYADIRQALQPYHSHYSLVSNSY
jgi:murein L,D-transpeptidase YafK